MNSALQWLGLGIAAALGATIALFRRYYLPDMASEDNQPVIAVVQPDVPVTAPTTPSEPPVAPETLLWDTPKRAYHSTRVTCDNMGLTFSEKETISACIFQESRFNNNAVGKNAKSTDWGIVQVNDFYHIGPGKTFPSVEYVLEHPEAMVRWMIAMYHAGQLRQWVSYSSKAYLRWLEKDSPMRALAV